MLEKLLGKFGYVKEVDYCADCRQIRFFKAKRLDDLEQSVRNLPATASFVSAFVIEENRGVSVRLTTSKAEFLALIRQARTGKIRLVF